MQFLILGWLIVVEVSHMSVIFFVLSVKCHFWINCLNRKRLLFRKDNKINIK